MVYAFYGDLRVGILQQIIESGFGIEPNEVSADTLHVSLSRAGFIIGETPYEQPKALVYVPNTPPAGELIRALRETLTDGIQPKEAKQSAKNVDLYEWQVDAVTAWAANQRRGIVQAVTGSGKTLVALEAIRRHLQTKKSKAVVLVPTTPLLDQWHSSVTRKLGVNVARLGGGYDRRSELRRQWRVLVCVGNSAKLYLRDLLSAEECSLLLVADECHRFGTEAYANCGLFDIPWAGTIGISATPDRPYDEGFKEILVPLLGDIVYKYNLAQALEDETVADLRVALVDVPFTSGESEAYDLYSDVVKRLKKRILSSYPDVRRGKAFFSDVKARRAEEAAADESSPKPATVYLDMVQKRQDVLVLAEMRLRFLFDDAIIRIVRSKKTLIFHKRISACCEIAKHLGTKGIRAGLHHSELSPSARKDVLEEFRRNTLGTVVSAETLTEGIDVPDASLAIVAAGSREQRALIQKTGRVLRRSEEKGVARVIIIYVRGTVEDPRLMFSDDENGDDFISELREMGKVEEYTYPTDRRAILGWFSDS
jgi:RNA polymerase primary sigma factor